MQTCRHTIVSKVIHREINRTLQMLIHRTLSAICEQDYFIDKVCISRLRNILINCWEQPQCIICTISRMSGCTYIRLIIWCILMTCIVIKLYKWKSTTIVYLCRQHETDLVQRHLWCQMDYALNILYRITVSVSISKSTVGERCGS